MKKTLLTIATVVLTAMMASATLSYVNQTLTYGSGSAGLLIPDGSPVGVASQMNFTANGTGNQMIDVTVGLNISGGYDGNLYAYLISPTGTLVVLMNQPGSAPFYAAGSGMTVTLDSSAGTGIQSATETYRQILSGTFAPLGNLSNIAAPGGNDGTGNGMWTLFFADLTRGGGQAYLDSWTLNLTVVPEPVTLALGLFVTMLIALAGLKRMWVPQAK